MFWGDLHACKLRIQEYVLSLNNVIFARKTLKKMAEESIKHLRLLLAAYSVTDSGRKLRHSVEKTHKEAS